MRDRYLVAVVFYFYCIVDHIDFYCCLGCQCNLKPASMRGVKSFAMVLCVSISIFPFFFFLTTFPYKATSKEGKEGGIEIIQPPAGSKPGDRVYFEGEEFESQY